MFQCSPREIDLLLICNLGVEPKGSRTDDSFGEPGLTKNDNCLLLQGIQSEFWTSSFEGLRGSNEASTLSHKGDNALLCCSDYDIAQEDGTPDASEVQATFVSQDDEDDETDEHSLASQSGGKGFLLEPCLHSFDWDLMDPFPHKILATSSGIVAQNVGCSRDNNIMLVDPSSIASPTDLIVDINDHCQSWHKRMVKLLEAMKSAQESQRAIQQWDRTMGLRRCHSKTMTETSISRRMLEKELLQATGQETAGELKGKKKEDRNKKTGGKRKPASAKAGENELSSKRAKGVDTFQPEPLNHDVFQCRGVEAC